MHFKEKLFRPIDNSTLIFFRIVFGFLLTAEAWGALATGWVDEIFIEPDYHFQFIDFIWLEPLPGNGMYFYFFLMGLAGIMIMIGLFYKFNMWLYAVLWAGVYLMQKEAYNNHYYLLMLLNFLMILLPAHRFASLDVRRNPKIKSLTCPQWCVWVVIGLMAIVYFYAAVAKLHLDWMTAKPLSVWFAAKQNYWLIGPLLAKSWFQYIIAWGGIFFDLLIVPALLWKKTRRAAFFISIFFHLFNSAVFQIGIFPYLAIALEVFFMDPELVRKSLFKKKPALSESDLSSTKYPVNQLLVFFLSCFFIIQILLPLRHHLYSGNVSWTEQGHRLAWRMMLRAKSGYVVFNITDNETQEKWDISPSDYLSKKQAPDIAVTPDMFWQFIQILKSDFASRGHDDISIYVTGKVILNGGVSKVLYDPNYDFSKAEWNRFAPSEWLMPYDDTR